MKNVRRPRTFVDDGRSSTTNVVVWRLAFRFRLLCVSWRFGAFVASVSAVLRFVAFGVFAASRCTCDEK